MTPLALLKYWKPILAVAVLVSAFSLGYYACHRNHLADEAEDLRKAVERADKAEKEKQAIEQKYLDQSQEIEDLRRSDANVDTYLNTPIPDSLKRLLNKR